MSEPEWKLTTKHLKRYPHFDAVLSVREANALANNPQRVAAHKFYPLILYQKRWNRFAPPGERGKEKSRPIRYAARSDAYIYARYRFELAKYYEVALAERGLGSAVIAYRRISDIDTGRGKCNIHFAKEAFETVSDIGDCVAVALDISSFFESLDHEILRQKWARLLGLTKLPPDHFAVFSAVTKYSTVDKAALYERLGHIGVKRRLASGREIKGYLTKKADMPIQLCDGPRFRSEIAGGSCPSLIRKNQKNFGIPQGTPISDLLANVYLIDFDTEIKEICDAARGRYFRYSDDILIIMPGGADEGREVMRIVREKIVTHGLKLKIKEEKCQIVKFTPSDEGADYSNVHVAKSSNGLEYLGFRFDGSRVYIRNSTLSNLRRKVARTSKRECYRLARRYGDRSGAELERLFDFERLIEKFGRVRDFETVSDKYKSWTFWTYAKRAVTIFGSQGISISRQLKRHRELVKERVKQDLAAAVASR